MKSAIPLEFFYDDFERIEEAFQEALDKSLDPSGPDSLYKIVEGLNLTGNSTVLDLGCAEGKYTLELAKRFGVKVTGVDPIEKHIQDANEKLAIEEAAEIKNLVSFKLGAAEEIPVGDKSINLIWFRDALVHVKDLEKAFIEIKRALTPGGHILIYHTFATDLLEPKEAKLVWSSEDGVPSNANRRYFEDACKSLDLEIEKSFEVGSEWKEYNEEHFGQGNKRLLHVARMLRKPDRYISKFGQEAYDIMLGDSLWHVYQMLGKISYWVYLLKN